MEKAAAQIVLKRLRNKTGGGGPSDAEVLDYLGTFGAVEQMERLPGYGGAIAVVHFRDDEAALRLLEHGDSFPLGGANVRVRASTKHKWAPGKAPPPREKPAAAAPGGKEKKAAEKKPAKNKAPCDNPKTEQEWMDWVESFIGARGGKVIRPSIGSIIADYGWSRAPFDTAADIMKCAAKRGLVEVTGNGGTGHFVLKKGAQPESRLAPPPIESAWKSKNKDINVVVSAPQSSKAQKGKSQLPPVAAAAPTKRKKYDIFMHNLPNALDQAQVKRLVETRFGPVSVVLRPRPGIAFVLFQAPSQAAHAIQVAEFWHDNRLVRVEPYDKNNQGKSSSADKEKEDTPAPPGFEDGDWPCQECGFVNFKRRFRCGKCACEIQTWKCVSCKWENYWHRPMCQRCPASRPPGVVKEGKSQVSKEQREVELREAISRLADEKEVTVDNPNLSRFCEICELHFESPKLLTQHLSHDENHKRRLREERQRRQTEEERMEEFYRRQAEEAEAKYVSEVAQRNSAATVRSAPVVSERKFCPECGARSIIGHVCAPMDMPLLHHHQQQQQQQRRVEPARIAPQLGSNQMVDVASLFADTPSQVHAVLDSGPLFEEHVEKAASLEEVLDNLNLSQYLIGLYNAGVPDNVVDITVEQFDAVKAKPFHRTKILNEIKRKLA